MWTVIYLARNKENAVALQNALEKEGILVKIRATCKDGAEGENCYEVLVPGAEVEEAHGIIIDIGF